VNGGEEKRDGRAREGEKGSGRKERKELAPKPKINKLRSCP